MAGRTAFVRDATGFIARNVVEELLAEGWEVVALHRSSTTTAGLDRLQVTLAAGDVTDAPSLLRAMPEGVAIVDNRLQLSSQRAERELGYRAVPLEVMVEDCYRWLVDEGLLERG